MKFIAIIPARKGSEGIKNKNFRQFCGKPLIYWTIKSAIQSKYVDQVIVTSDSPKILDYCKKTFSKKILLLRRKKKLSLGNTPMHPVIKDAYKRLNLENFVFMGLILLQPTSPLRDKSDIDKACKLFLQKKADSLVSVCELNHKFNPEGLFIKKKNYLYKFSKTKAPSLRQKKKKYYSNNGAAIYITLKKNINKYIFGGKILGYEMTQIKSIDIDTDFDFKLAELIKVNGLV
jgi:CMP-N-acetylneuraminic acid synthetase